MVNQRETGVSFTSLRPITQTFVEKYIIALSIVDQLTLSRQKESFTFLSSAIELADLNRQRNNKFRV